jgi:dethiobiotin synthase
MAKIKHLFVTGTDTGVGKTVVSAILTGGISANYWKPIQCGLQGQTDTEFVQEVTGLSADHFHKETYRLTQPLSPHAAAEMDNVQIDSEKLCLPKANCGRTLIVEGAGGIMVPLNQDFYMLDLMKKLDIPILLVARSTLGTINHTLLSLQALRSHGLTVLGIVMNGPRHRGNKEALEKYGEIKVLAEVEPIAEMQSIDCSAEYLKSFPTGLFE